MRVLTKPLLLLCGLGLTITACDEDLTELVFSLNDVTITMQPGLYPEGIDYSSERDRYVISSVTTGRIGLVNPDDSSYTVLVNDNRILSAVGVLVDDDRNRVLVAMSDLGASPRSTPATARKTAMLGSFDLETGRANWVADLAALNRAGDSLNFANDIAIDDDGAAYVTNSFSPIIYKVEENGTPSIFRRDARLGAPAGQFGANGIVAFDDYLIVAHSANRSLVRVSLDDAADILTVELDGEIPASPDGLERVGRDQLAIVANAAGQVLQVDLDEGGKEGNIRERFLANKGQFPTTAVARAGDVVVLYAYLNKLMMGDLSQASYELQRFDF